MLIANIIPNSSNTLNWNIFKSVHPLIPVILATSANTEIIMPDKSIKYLSQIIIILEDFIKYVKLKINHMTHYKLRVYWAERTKRVMPSPQENVSMISIEWCLFSANFFGAYPIHGRAKLVHLVCTTPVRFDSILKIILRAHLRGEYCVLPLRAKALPADSRNDPDKRDASTSDTKSRQRRLVSFRSSARSPSWPRLADAHRVQTRAETRVPSPRIKHNFYKVKKWGLSRERAFCHYFTVSEKDEWEKKALNHSAKPNTK